MQAHIQTLQAVLYSEIPLTRYLRLTVDDYNGKALRVSAPLADNVNHFGTAFAGSLSTVATLAGWSMVWFVLKECELEGNIVIQESHCHYFLPVTRDFTAYCQKPEAAQLENFEQTLRQKGKARLELHVDIPEQDKVAFAFQGRYVVLPNQKGSQAFNQLEAG
ncbi:MAG TPA: thioesterase domain-containing protein [Ktedonobacteraceae bacterium]|nr:thioesterase domain-containing protein [Ktedonobacteraceae bacterium]